MFGPPHRKNPPTPSTRVMWQAKQMLLDKMQHCMTKSKPQDSNALAESADISPKSTQKEDVEAGADHDSPRMVPRMHTEEEG